MRAVTEEQEHSINKIFPFSFSGDEESESDSKSDCSDESKSIDDGDEPDEEEEHDQSDDELPMMATPFRESDNEENESYYESDDEDEHSEGEKQGNSIAEMSSFRESVYEESESDSESDCNDEYKSVAEYDHKDEPDEEEEHDQSDDDLPMLIFQFSESDDEESESYNESDDEDEQREEEELDHHSDEITEDQEEMYFAKEEDNDKKFDSEDAPNLQLLHCREEISQKCDAEEFDLGILFGAEERDHNLNSVKVSSLCSLVEKVEPDDVWDSEDESNKDQFNEIEAQGPPNQNKQQQQHCSEHVMEHRPNKSTKKRKNIFMGWVCSKILKIFIKSKVLL